MSDQFQFEFSFPNDFVWGAATSAYQIEGAWNLDGKGENVWDRFCHSPHRVAHGDTGDIACDHYNRMQDDVELMAWLGLKAYRFSVSWARILPTGKLADGVNRPGVEFYDRLVDALLEKGIVPNATLNHWDFPQALHEEGGWENPSIVERFCEYAGIMFNALGDRVGYWATHNEPKVVALNGYLEGTFPPGHASMYEALLTTHHLHLAHGKAVQLFRSGGHAGKIGIVLDIQSYQPASGSEADQAAALRLHDLNNRLYLDPILLGEYPVSLFDWLGAQVPEPVRRAAPGRELKLMSEPIDYLGMNYYMTFQVRHTPNGVMKAVADNYSADGWGYNTMGWGINPAGLLTGLMNLMENYGNPVVYITENGIPVQDQVGPDGTIDDTARIRYLREHILQLHTAREAGARVAGYYVWSLMDNFEWAMGYEPCFGLVHVDRTTLERRPKRSAYWYRRLIEDNMLRL